MNTNFAKICAIAIVGGVVKALFGPAPAPVTHVHNHPAKPENANLALVEDKDES